MIKIIESYITEEIILKRNKWENDPKINHFTIPNFNEKELPLRTFEETYIESILRIEEASMYDYLIFENDELIGECNIMLDPDHLEKKIPGSAWVGLVIGESTARGRGIGKEVMEFLEFECENLNVKRIELGVFKFNERAVKLYKSMDYHLFAELDNFTYWNGKWHSDLRLEKYIK